MSGGIVPNQASDPELNALKAELVALRHTLLDEVKQGESMLADVHTERKASAINLLHYLALRRRDMRFMQRRLAAMGLSSLGRAESHVLSCVESVISILQRICNNQWIPSATEPHIIDYAHGEALLREHSEKLFGMANKDRSTRIMVTMPREAADDSKLVRDLLQNGMECMRINCAHDSPEVWSRMISNLALAKQALDRNCRVMMDLAGPKLRTGQLSGNMRVLKLRPKRDEFGKILQPAKVRLSASELDASQAQSDAPTIKVDGQWLSRLEVGDSFRLRDARKSKRRFKIVDKTAESAWAIAYKTTYLVPQTKLIIDQGDKPELISSVSLLPTGAESIFLQPGDTVVLSGPDQPGRDALRDENGDVLEPARIGCSLPEIFEDVKPGEAIWFDDGRIGGIIETVYADHLTVVIHHTPPNGAKLKADKGINLPESDLRLSAMTEKDRQDIRFIVKHSDMVALSFANNAQDVAQLQQCLNETKGPVPAIILKVETRRGFENLPNMLLTAMHRSCSGVMIARGDLAVECGFERLAEVQEEILWLCEAAHIPVIWATQVLESLAKEGLPSRAEITDAAMGHRAECVMLNKGPHIVNAVRTLDDILRRMQAHQDKKQAMLRELHVADNNNNWAGTNHNK